MRSNRLVKIWRCARVESQLTGVFLTWAALTIALLHPQSLLAQSASARPQTSDWASVLSAARKDRKVVLYTSQTAPVVARVAAGFRKAYPDIEIQFTRGPVVPQVEAERATGADGADVYISAQGGWFLDRSKEGALLKPVGPALAGWPSQYINGSAVSVGFEYFVIAYNKKMVTTPPKGYADLLRPEFTGRLSAAELSATAIVSWYDWLEKTQGRDFLTRLKAQKPKLHIGCLASAQAVAAGEVAASLLGCVPTSKLLMEQNAPIDYVKPNPSYGIQFVAGALGWSKRPNAALVLVDYVMSRDGQTAWHGTGESASPLKGIPGALEATSIDLPDPNGFPEDVENRYREYWTKIFK